MDLMMLFTRSHKMTGMNILGVSVAWIHPRILAFSPGPPTEESSSMATVVLRAAEVLDLTLPTVETKQTILTEVSQPSHKGVEPLIPLMTP